MNDDAVLIPLPLFKVLFRTTLDEILLPELPEMYLLEPGSSFNDFKNVVELLLLFMSCWDFI